MGNHITFSCFIRILVTKSKLNCEVYQPQEDNEDKQNRFEPFFVYQTYNLNQDFFYWVDVEAGDNTILCITQFHLNSALITADKQ